MTKVDVVCRLVEDEDRGLLEAQACQRKQRLLPFGQRFHPLAHRALHEQKVGGHRAHLAVCAVRVRVNVGVDIGVRREGG